MVCSGCLDTLAAMQELKMGVASAEEETQAVMKVFSKEDYSVVNRFESKYRRFFIHVQECMMEMQVDIVLFFLAFSLSWLPATPDGSLSNKL